MGIIGFLHTSATHVPRFDELVESTSPHSAVHHVDEALLADAILAGTGSVRSRVGAAVEKLAAAGADLVICTCSTLGLFAEEVAGRTPVMRVDRPMAAAAVRQGRRIGLVIAVESTAEASEALISEEASWAGCEVAVEVVCVQGAWAHFLAGDTDTYVRLVAATARNLAPRVDVLVLAQVSMTDAADHIKDLSVPVLTSPREAVRHAVLTLR